LPVPVSPWISTVLFIGETSSRVEKSARMAGAQAMHFNGRPGWVKLCEPMGYKVMQVIMEKPLTTVAGGRA